MSAVNKGAQRIGVSVLFFIFGFGFATWASRIPNIQEVLHLTDKDLGFFLFAIPIGDVITMPFSGYLTATFGTKKLTNIAIPIYVLVLISLGFSTTELQLLISMFCLGMVSNLVSICINTQSVLVQKLYSDSIMGSFHGVWSIAGFTGALVGALFIYLKITASWHFLLTGLIILALLIYASPRLVPESELRRKEKIKLSWPDKNLILLGFIALSCMITEGTMFDWSGIYFKKEVNISPRLQSLGFAVFMGSMATGRFICDFFINKFGQKFTLRISGILISTGLIIAVAFPYVLPASFGFLMVGFGVASVIPIVFATAGKSTLMAPSIAITIVTSIGFIGFLGGPPLVGSVSGMFGLKNALLIISGFGAIIFTLGSFLSVTENK